MLTIRKEDNPNFRSVVKAIKEIADEGTFYIDRDGMKFYSIDGPHVCFLSYINPRISSERATCITLNIQDLYKILQKINEGVEIESDGKTFKIIYETAGKRKTFTLPILDSLGPTTEKPNIKDFTARAVLNTRTLYDLIKDVELVSDSLTISLSTGAPLKIIAEEFGGSKTYKAEVVVSEGNGEARASFGVSYLEKTVAACLDFSGMVEISLSNKSPLCIRAKNGDECLEFLIAPRM